jgi:TatD DNase family protein
MTLIDSHCHLDFKDFIADRSEVIQRALNSGVSTMLNPSTDIENSKQVSNFAEQYPEVYAAVGIHPNFSAEWNADNRIMVEQLAASDNVVAIGEIGLDYYWNKAPKGTQAEAFRGQLELAADLNLPVIIHNREAGDDVLAILLDWQASLERQNSPLAKRPGVLHSFSGDREMAMKAIAAGFFIGLTGPVTFKNTKPLQAIVEELPLDYLLIETDSPFLTPHPHRGQRNEPAKVKLVAEKIADLKHLPFEEIATATTANAKRLFRFGERE